MAELLGVSTGTIGNWETRASSPGFEELERIAEKLGESPAFLLGFSESSLATGGLLLKEAPAAPGPWLLLSDETLRQAVADLSQSRADHAMDHLASVVAEIRGRGAGKKTSVDGSPRSRKVAQGVDDLAKLKPGKPTP